MFDEMDNNMNNNQTKTKSNTQRILVSPTHSRIDSKEIIVAIEERQDEDEMMLDGI